MFYVSVVATGIFIVISIIAGLLGYGGIALAAAEIARILFFLLLAILIVNLIAGAANRNRRRSWHSELR